MKHETRTRRAWAANILAFYLDAPDLTRALGREWYAEESKRCADFARRHGRTLPAVAGAAAAISPGLRWEFTFAHLAALLKDPEAKVPTYSRANVLKALRCLRGDDPRDVLGGPKVIAFYNLLVTGAASGDVVIDGHAMDICRMSRKGVRNTERFEIRAARYRVAADAYREAADVLGESAHAVQATCWIHWREAWGVVPGREPGED